MNLQFTIKLRLILLSFGLVLVPLALGVLITGNNSLNLVSDALVETNKNALVSIREQKKQQLTGYIKTLQGQITTLASNSMIIGATDEFTYSFEDYINEVNNDNDSLINFYEDIFNDKYHQLNGESYDVSALLPSADTNASSLQSAYIADNPNSLGNKNKLIYAEDSSTYGKVHEAYHPSIEGYLQEFGYYDIFIINYESGDVIYSVFKEIDFATNLITGPHKHSGLATAYKSAKNLKAGQVYTTDFQNYVPSFNVPAAFISTPIYDGDAPLGVLVFQIPLERISKIMSNDERWQEVGLGLTGETYLVGSDNTLRSHRRLFVENKNRYLKEMREIGQSNEADIVERVDNAIGVQKIETPSVTNALRGDTGYLSYVDAMGGTILSAYTQINSGGENWALIAEISEDEAYKTYALIKSDLLWMSMVTVAVFLIVGVGAGFLVSKRISDHILHLADVMDDISKGDGDLTAKIDYDGRNEFGDISRSFNEIISNFHKIISNVRDTSQKILNESSVVQKGANESQITVHSQLDATQSSVAALEQFEKSITNVANNSDESQKITITVAKECIDSSKQAQTASNDIEKLMETLDQTSGVIDDLNREVSDITSVLDVINSIADQTNLLALNAAIEAARAGEHGRGFSVVAEEVRNLALRTQESTIQIQQKLEILSRITAGVVSSMTSATNVANTAVTRVSGLKVTLGDLSDKVGEMEQNIESVAIAIKQQTQTITEINQNMLVIDEQSQLADNLAQENESSANNLIEVANEMNNQVSKFKLD